MPPGTGVIELTLCQVVPLMVVVIVTTSQKLAFIDVAKGIWMFSKLMVPCVAVVESMCHFDAYGKRHYPLAQVVNYACSPRCFTTCKVEFVPRVLFIVLALYSLISSVASIYHQAMYVFFFNPLSSTYLKLPTSTYLNSFSI